MSRPAPRTSHYRIPGPDAVWPRSLPFEIQQSDADDLLGLYRVQTDSWIGPRTRGEGESAYMSPNSGGVPRVLGGKGIDYQKRLPGEIEVEGWNTAEVIARGDSTVHILNGKVVNQGKKIRLVDPNAPGRTTPVTRGRIALEIEAAEIDFRNVEMRLVDRDRSQRGAG